MSAKELKDRLKALRNEHAGKPITKMTAEELEREISHHETAQKAAELKAKRLEALAKAREAKKGPPTLVVKKAPVKAAPVKEVKPRKTAAKKIVEEYPEVSDEEVVVKKKVAKKGSETISDRIAKKSERSDE
jgi:preprotein translocase subunit SecD